MRTAKEIVDEIEKRAKYFERKFKRDGGEEFSLGAYSNLRAMALWSKSAPRKKAKAKGVEL